jgi:methionyl-tRNA formyltransferase
MGTPQFAVPSLKALIAAYEVVAVYTQPDAPSGRGKALMASPVKQVALAHQIPVYQPESLKKPEEFATLSALAPDLIVVAAYGQILRQNVLDLPRYRCINVHASLLPRWRGAAPISAAIAAGDTHTGITIMLMEAGLDSGPMLSQRGIPIGPDDTTGLLFDKLATLGADLLIETLPHWLSDTIKPQLQDESKVTLAGRMNKEQGRIDWACSVAAVERHIRAMQPWPSAFTSWRGKQLKISRARLGQDHPAAKAANGAVSVDRNHVFVQCGNGLLQLEEIQLEGKRSLPADEFVRGHKDFAGSVLG